MRRPNPKNPKCPDCGKQSRHKRTNQDGREIYDCTCGWSNSAKRIPRSPLKRKELNAIAINAAIQFYQQDTYRGSFVDISQVIGGSEKWLYSCDKLVKEFKRVLKNNV